MKLNAKICKIVSGLAVLAVLLASCQSIPFLGGNNLNPPPIAAVTETSPLPAQAPAGGDTGTLSAQGRVVPNQSVNLAFVVSGKISEILAKQGDTVKKGAVLARLGDTEQLQAAVANGELALLTAQQALDDLNKTSGVARSAILADLSAQQQALKTAQFNLDNYQVSDEQKKLDPISAVDVTKQRLDAARKAYDPYRFEPAPEEPLTAKSTDHDRLVKDLKDKLDFAQHEYNSAVQRVQYQFQVEVAQARLDKDKKDLADMGNGADPDKLALAQANVKAMQANLAAAQASLNNAQLIATIDGVVVDDHDLVVGQQITPGMPIFQLGDTADLYVETEDLTEVDIVRVKLGQKVTVVADALPDVEMSGVVDYIPDVFVDKRGDVTYTVKIKLDKIDPRLRWGMTVKVTF